MTRRRPLDPTSEELLAFARELRAGFYERDRARFPDGWRLPTKGARVAA